MNKLFTPWNDGSAEGSWLMPVIMVSIAIIAYLVAK